MDSKNNSGYRNSGDGNSLFIDEDNDEEEPGDVHAPCPPPSPTIGKEIVPEDPFPDSFGDEFKDDGEGKNE